jgi:hypothetical protein
MNIEKLDNLIGMLVSKDKENQIVALSIIEEIQKESSILPLLLALKLGHASEKQWLDNAPEAFMKAQKICGKEKWRRDLNLTYETIYKIIQNTKQKPEDKELFTEYLTEHIRKNLQHIGYTFIKDIKLIIDE